MPELLEAQRGYKHADEEALLLRFRARARLGLAVVREVEKGSTLEAIGETLQKTAEQARRYRQAYWDWQRIHPDEPLEG